MADVGIKKVVIKKDSLPPIGPNNEYLFRYRIVSTDKNRTSYWSPVYSLTAPKASPVSGSIKISQDSVQIFWTDPVDENDKEAYDIFVSFDDGDFFCHGQAYSHSYSFLNPGATKVEIVIQLEGVKKVLNDHLEIFRGTDTLVV